MRPKHIKKLLLSEIEAVTNNPDRYCYDPHRHLFSNASKLNQRHSGPFLMDLRPRLYEKYRKIFLKCVYIYDPVFDT